MLNAELFIGADVFGILGEEFFGQAIGVREPTLTDGLPGLVTTLSTLAGFVTFLMRFCPRGMTSRVGFR